MKNKTRYLVLGLLLLGMSVYGTGRVLAEDESTYPPFVQTIAQKLGLDESQVEEAFDEIRAEHFAEMQEAREERLSEAVTDGIITEEQKNALIAKWEEMHAEHAAQRQDRQTEMQQWYEEMGIDQTALREYVSGPWGMKEGMGFGKHR